MIENSKLGYYLVPILKVWLFMFFLLLCTLPFALITQLNFIPSISYPLAVDILMQASLVLVVLGALLMMFKVLPELNFYWVFIREAHALSGFLKGAGIGFCFIISCAGLLYLNGNVSFEHDSIPWGAIGLYIIYFLLISVFEELLFRSYPLYAFSERYPLWFAIFVNGLLFALAHFSNPGLSILGIINITLVGILLAIYTLQKQNIGWAIGIHFSWNFTQAIVLGYNVSGNHISGMAKAIPIGPDYLSGGKFGLEGSVCCTIFLIIWIVWLYYKGGFGNVEIYGLQFQSYYDEDA